MLLVIDVQRVVVKGRQRSDDAAHDGHGMGFAAKALNKGAQLFMHHSVALDGGVELLALSVVRQFAVQQQVAQFQVVGLLRELVDGVAAVQQHPSVAVDVGDRGVAGGGGNKAGIIGEIALAGQGTDVDDVRTLAARHHR